MPEHDKGAALLRIAFDDDVSALAGDPGRWPCTIAYEALGGRFENGRRIDGREALAERLRVAGVPEDGWRDISTADGAKASGDRREGGGGMDERFPILVGKTKTTIPWAAIAPHERQAQRNHGQTLRRLADRGGLSWGEAWAVMTGRHWADIPCGQEERLKAEVMSMIEARAVAARRKGALGEMGGE